MIEQALRETALPLDPLRLRVAEGQRLQIPQRLLQTGRDEKVALRRQFSHEQLAACALLHALVQVGLEQGQLVEIGQQRAELR